MQIKGQLLKQLQQDINQALVTIDSERIKAQWSLTKARAVKDAKVDFMNSFIELYFTARQTLGLTTYDRCINDAHIFTAIKYCLKRNTKTAFIFS